MKKFGLLVLGASLAFGSLAQANSLGVAPQGFNNTINSVSDVLKNGYDDQYVTLKGRLTNYLGRDRYEFTDTNGGKIEVELDDDYNWSHITKDQLIQITGKIDKDIFSTVIEVKNAQPLE